MTNEKKPPQKDVSRGLQTSFPSPSRTGDSQHWITVPSSPSANTEKEPQCFEGARALKGAPKSDTPPNQGGSDTKK